MKRKLILYGFWVGWVYLVIVGKVAAQSPYVITISEKEQKTDSNFLKMGTAVSPSGETFSYTDQYLTHNGKPWYPVMGEMPYSRCWTKDWEDALLKMKSDGIQVISTYVFWNHTEKTEGVFDWSGNNNLRAFLALCQKHGMYVWLRVGPWVHAESRNGGFPDWLQNKPVKLRTSDSAYLFYTKRFFTSVAEQCRGYWFGQGGNIIGVQLENELAIHSGKDWSYLLTLKRLAVRAGMDVPYYSDFGQGPDDQSDFLYTMGSYPESPWRQDTKKFIKPVFFIRPLEADTDIGSDLLGKVDGRVRNSYPKISAEIGGGLQVTYHRRTIVSAEDVAANVYTKIAGGLNGLGYYLFTGGLNPVAATSLQESRMTGYPNDVALINYDFYAPVGAMNIVRKSYGELRLLNLFLNDFGDSLATKPAFFPAVKKMSLIATDTVQCSVRAKNNSGFIFLSNYQRYVDMPPVKPFRLQLQSSNGTVMVPEKATGFPANSYRIWPYNMPVCTARLRYATAQPLCILHNPSENTYVFFATGSPEFVFAPEGIQQINRIENCHIYDNKVECLENKMAVFELLDTKGQSTKIIVLPKEIALKAFKIKQKNGESLWITDAQVTQSADELSFEKTGDKGKVNILVYPDVSLSASNSYFHIDHKQVGHKQIDYEQVEYKQANHKLFNSNAMASDSQASNLQADHKQSDYKQADDEQPDDEQPGHKQVDYKQPGLKKNSGFFSGYTLQPLKEGKASLTQQLKETRDDSSATRQYADSLLRKISTGKYYTPHQQGPLYRLQYHDLPGQRCYTIGFLSKPSPVVKDWQLSVVYSGDMMAVYKDNRLVYDQFNADDSCNLRASYFFTSGKKDSLLLQVLPLPAGSNIYVEDFMKKTRDHEWDRPSVSKIILNPVYSYQLEIREPSPGGKNAH